MVKSMTGFGRVVLETDELSVQIELKTLNSKFLDSNIKMSYLFFDKEIEIKNLLNKKLERGKVSLNINYVSKKPETNKIQVNFPLVSNYYKELKKSADDLGTNDSDIFRMIMQMPDAYIKEQDQDAIEKDWKVVAEALNQAIEKCTQFRIHEGEILKSELNGYIDNIRNLLKNIEELDPERIKHIRERLQKQVNDLVSNENFDPNRFEQELIYYIEKLDISEEKVRLNKHLDLFQETLKAKISSGKKLTFISQEIGREINTIGAKANFAELQKFVVDMKDNLEKIKEQLFNIV
ncbi:YicC/YloC family endoribonuclease [Flexithrix dorotheae]|uniref:YicC/YloC family endoribonuclease n=1 Tax=Flexithrix dorotheae TaxID=70993 RepID=UPI000367A1A1|nr:YicC/YloC family endoribonuclease [Flexithrix dorotheae]